MFGGIPKRRLFADGQRNGRAVDTARTPTRLSHMMLSSKQANLLWPRHRFPGARRALSTTYRTVSLLAGRTGFQVWKMHSRLRFGSTRWASVYDGLRVTVRIDDYRGYRIAMSHGTQKEKVLLWRQAVQFGPDICVDVGANYGEFSVSAAALGTKLITVEANPMIIPCLTETLAPYRTTTIVHAAATETDSQSQFFYNAAETGSASIAAAGPSKAINRFRGRISTATVPTRRLDTLVPELLGRQPRSVILKMDVEGFEESVLAGALDLLDQADWWRAMIEFNPTALRNAGSDPARFWAALRTFPGFVVGTARVPSAQLARLDPTLPPATPEADCDVLIGRGTPD